MNLYPGNYPGPQHYTCTTTRYVCLDIRTRYIYEIQKLSNKIQLLYSMYA